MEVVGESSTERGWVRQTKKQQAETSNKAEVRVYVLTSTGQLCDWCLFLLLPRVALANLSPLEGGGGNEGVEMMYLGSFYPIKTQLVSGPSQTANAKNQQILYGCRLLTLNRNKF